MFKFFTDKGNLPEGFDEVYLCDVLGLTYTDLQNQPSEWVDKMMMLKVQKSQAEKWEMEKKQPKR